MDNFVEFCSCDNIATTVTRMLDARILEYARKKAREMHGTLMLTKFGDLLARSI